jgi:RNA polymerase sigma-70 factor, ECF subfamily
VAKVHNRPLQAKREDPCNRGHELGAPRGLPAPPGAGGAWRAPLPRPEPLQRPTFAAIYANELSFLRQSLRWLGVNEVDLDDVLQEVLLAVHRGLGSYAPWYSQRPTKSEVDYGDGHGRADPALPDGPDPLKRWLFGIAWRQVSTFRSRAYRRREVCAGAGSTWPHEILDPAPGPEHSAAADQRGRLVGELLQALPSDRRVVLVMHDLLDVGVPEIADDLSTCESTVWSRLHQARTDFRAAVARRKKEERTVLRGILPVAEARHDVDMLRLPVAARVIPEVPDDVRRRVWRRLERAMARPIQRQSPAPPPAPRPRLAWAAGAWPLARKLEHASAGKR